MNTFPLLQSQLGVVVQDMQHPGSTQYNLPIHIFMPRALHREMVVSAIQKLIATFPVLHTRYVSGEDGEIRQWCDMSMTIPVVSRQCTESELQAYISDGFIRPFNLFSGEPLFRVEVVETEKCICLMADFHHSMIDGISIAPILVSALEAIFRGNTVETPSYSMYQAAEDEKASFGTPLYQRAKDYYAEKFAGMEMATLSRSQSGTLGRMGRYTTTVNRRACDDWCREHGFQREDSVQTNLLFQAAFSHVISVLTRQERVAYSTLHHGRMDRRLRGSVGMFVKNIPIVVDVNPQQKVVDFVKSVGSELASNISNSIYPFTHFCSNLNMKPGMAFNFFAKASMEEHIKVGGYEFRVVQPVRKEIDSDLSVDIYLHGEDYEIRVQSSLAMNDEAILRMVAEAMRVAVCNMMAHPDATLGELDIVSSEERKALVQLGTGKHLDIDPSMTFVKAFEHCAKQHPESLAVADAASSLTYSELSHRSDVLAHRLIAAGVQPDDFVCVMLDRCKEFPLSVLAIHKAGAAYTPLDFEYPSDRLQYMLDDSRSKVLITSRSVLESKQAEGGLATGDVKIIFIEDIDFGAETSPVDLTTPEGLAYMIYTSGSTGKPKGVMLHQAGLWNFIAATIDMEKLTADDRISGHRSFSFDAHIGDMFPVLTLGGSFHIMPSEIRKDLAAIRDFLFKHEITGCGFTTSLTTLLLNTYDDLPVRFITAGGEKLNAVYSNHIEIINLYGPTECTDDTSYYSIAPGTRMEDIPIGRPVANSWNFIVDSHSHLLPRGAEGELCVAGIQVGRGYWQMPELTAEKFVDCPFVGEDHWGRKVRMYRTGDLCRWNDEGQLEYIGRIDNQMKLRGYRIELGEIEACAARFEGISQAVAAVKTISGSDMLCLYYTSAMDIDTEDLKAHLSQRLVSHMVPAAFIKLDTMPMTPNGKTDRRRLPEPQLQQEIFESPATELEQQLYDIVAEQLGTTAFGVTTDLVTLGLSSLDAMRLSMAVGQRTGLLIGVDELLGNPTIRHMAEAAGRPRAASDTDLTAFSRQQDQYPLTSTQRGIYIDWELNRGTTQYNVPLAVCLGQTSPQVLADALRQVVNAHSYIKTHLTEDEGNVVQQRRDEAPVEVSVTALDAEPDSSFFQQRVRPFNLFADDLYRLEIYAFGGRTWLFKDFHHIVSDGLSDAVFFRDLLAALRGMEPQRETVTAFDYALYEQHLTGMERYSDARHYFDTLVSGAEAASYPHTASGTVHRSMHVKSVITDSESVRRSCHRMGITPNSYFQTVVAQVLHRLTRQQHLMLATVSSGRSLTQTENIMGLFVKTLPMVSAVSPDGVTFATAAQAMHRQSIESIGYDFYPLAETVERHGLHPEILYAFEEGIFDFAGTGISPDTDVIVPELDTQKMPIELTVYTDGKGAYVLLVGYDSALYSQTSMSALANAITTYAVHAAKDGILLSDIELTTQEERDTLIALGEGKHLDIDPEMTFVKAFEQCAKQYPDNLAVADKNQSLTYSELSHRSDVLAHRLIALGVKPGDFVAVMLERTVSFPLAVIGIHKAGAAYVPIDLDYPKERQKYMLDDSGARIVIDEQFMADTDFSVASCPVDLSSPDGLAYMIYTSGSTGRPKGAMLYQSGLYNFIAVVIDMEKLTCDDRISGHRSFSFDAHIEDLFPILTLGGSFHVMPTEIRRDLAQIRQFLIGHEITGGGYSTAMTCLLLNAYDDLPMRFITGGGEKMDGVFSDHIEIINVYGPTECTCTTSCYKIAPGNRLVDVPIGRPVANCYYFIVDSQGRLLPRGAVGELCIAGIQVGLGYWHQPELTAEKFCDCPFVTDNISGAPVRMYHTGDLCRWIASPHSDPGSENEDGEMEYVGRMDNQVKLRGYRIELGEIEVSASRFEGVKQVVAVVRPVSGIDTLCLYYTGDAVSPEALKGYLSANLPSYMVPSAFEHLDAMPLTPNGKIDRRHLPDPIISTHTAYVAPQGLAEETVARLTERVLSCQEPVSMLDNFFVLGGDSIKMISLASQLHKEGFTAQVSALMQCGTLSDMARVLVSSGTLSIPQEPLTGTIIPGAIQQRFLTWHLPQAGRFTQSVLLRVLQPVNMTILQEALKALAAHHDMLRAVVSDDTITVRPASGDRLFALREATLAPHTIAEVATAEGELIDLAHGPLLRVVVLHMDDGDRLLMVCHHIAIDGVSWRILTDDLATALHQLGCGQAVALPARTHSFGYWTEAVSRYRDSYLLSLEKPYWQRVQQQLERMHRHTLTLGQRMELTPAFSGKQSTRKLKVSLKGEPVKQLLTVSAKAFNTEINDLLITALCQSYRQVTGKNGLAIQMEGHGREPIHESVSTDRTIGWFTSVYPVIIQDITGDVRQDVRSIKEQLRAVPNKGIGYGILQYLESQEGDASLRTDLTPILGFNYLGQTDSNPDNSVLAADNSFLLADGQTAGQLGVPIPSIDINCAVHDGQFLASLEYDCECWDDETAQQLADAFVEALASVASHTAHVKAPEPTASDFGAMGWSDSQLKDIIGHFTSRSEMLQRVYPLTPMQEGILISYLSDHSTTAYRLLFRLSMSMLPTEAMLRHTLDYLAEKHEVLRTAILYENVPQPCQAVLVRQLGLEMRDLTGEPDVEAAAARVHQELLHRPLSLTDDPLFSLVCMKTGNDSCQLIVFTHHIIVDGWCDPIIFNDFLMKLEAESDGRPLEATTDQQGRYEAFVRQLFRRDRKTGLSYWKDLLAGYGTRAAIPAYGKPSGPEAKLFVSHTLDKDLTSSLQQLAARTGVTLNTVMELGWGLMLQSFCRTDDAVFARVVSGRDNRDGDKSQLVGLFINSVPVRVRTASTDSVVKALHALQTQAAQSAAYDFCPLAEIQAQTSLGSSLFQSVMVFENYPLGDTLLTAGHKWAVKPVQIEEEAFNELSVAVVPRADGTLRLTLSYDTSLYGERQIRQIADTFGTILSSMAAMPNGLIGELALVSNDERKALVQLGTGKHLDIDPEMTFVKAFEQCAKQHPDNIAVADATDSLTYRELSRRSDILAHRLIERGVKPGNFVAVMLGRTTRFPLAVIAILKAGAAYVPIDLDYPKERQKYMLDDSGARIVIDDQFMADLDYAADVSPIDLSTPDGLAYMIYTSGSTGQPKGAMLRHTGLWNTIQNMIDAQELTCADRLAAYCSFSFDPHTLDLFPILTLGGSSHIMPSAIRLDLDAIRQFIIDHQITGGIYTTSLAKLLLDKFDDLPLRFIAPGGEKLTSVYSGHLTIINCYGPTECTCTTSCYKIAPGNRLVDVPIGRPFANCYYFIMDSHGRLLPRGAEGELCIAGIQVGVGYWQQPELTAEKFTDCPFVSENIDGTPVRMYHTGDLCRWNDEGEMEYIGRIDSQVKIRGYRIELGEIEACAASFEGVSQAVAAVKTISGNDALYLYYTADEDIDAEALKAHLSERLASYMVPTASMRLDAMPMTPNGKIDRKQLPEPTTSVKVEAVPPHSEREGVLLLMAQQVLGRDDFGVTDDLFDLGLTSITAIKVAAMCAAYGIQISVNNLMRLRTIERLIAIEPPVGYWFNGYRPDKPVLIAPHGVVPVISMTDKFHDWKQHFSIYTLEPTDEHAARLTTDYDYEKLIDAYAGYLNRDIPADAHIAGFIGLSWGGEVAYSLATRWQQERGGKPAVFLCDTVLVEPDAPKMTEEQITQGLIQYLVTHPESFDLSALQQQTAEDGSNLLNAAFVKCTKDMAFATEMLKMIARKFHAAELCRRMEPLSVYDGPVIYFGCTRENHHLAESLAKWQELAPGMEVVTIDDNHMNFMIRNDNNYVVTERLLKELRK